jgi:hypothetical protein
LKARLQRIDSGRRSLGDYESLLGRVESWRRAREEVPGLQLAIGGRIDAAAREGARADLLIPRMVADELRLLSAGVAREERGSAARAAA